MLCLPHLETMASCAQPDACASALHRMLVKARNGVRADLAAWHLDGIDLPDAVRGFLLGWIRREISVT
jgi:hypothetical protein